MPKSAFILHLIIYPETEKQNCCDCNPLNALIDLVNSLASCISFDPIRLTKSFRNKIFDLRDMHIGCICTSSGQSVRQCPPNTQALLT